MAMDNNGILMPDNILYKAMKNFFQIIKKDYKESAAGESMLETLFDKDENNGKIEFETLDYLKQSKKTLIDNDIQVNMGYNLEVAQLGSVHILLPNESGSPLPIGGDENYREPQTFTEGGEDYKREFFTAKFDSTYQILITSENIFEVLIIYYYLKFCFVSMHYNLEFLGLRDLKIGGQDINIQQDKVPQHIFHRTITLNFFHESTFPNFMKTKLVKQFKQTGIII